MHRRAAIGKGEAAHPWHLILASFGRDRPTTHIRIQYIFERFQSANFAALAITIPRFVDPQAEGLVNMATLNFFQSVLSGFTVVLVTRGSEWRCGLCNWNIKRRPSENARELQLESSAFVPNAIILPLAHHYCAPSSRPVAMGYGSLPE